MDSLNGWIQKVTGSSENSGKKMHDSSSAKTSTQKPSSSKVSKEKSSVSEKKTPRDGDKPFRSGNSSRGNTRSQQGGQNRRNSQGGNRNNAQGRGGRKPNHNPKATFQKRLPERSSETIPSKPIERNSVSDIPKNRKQRPRPMLGRITREVASRKFPQHEKFPEGDPMRVIPLGGLNEVGKNSMCIDYKGDLLVIDIGLQFPEENMPGVDYVIPDLSYVVERKDRLKALLITHGHLDHIGAIHLYIEKLGFPTIYATRLTKALIEKRLEEHNLLEKTEIILIDLKKAESRFAIGNFTIEYFGVSHSIPDSSGIFIKTPAGSMIHTGDFKFDLTPIDGMAVDYHKLVKFSQEGVDVIFADSTNALRDGFCPSEKVIAENIGRVVREAVGKRLIVATFSSSLGRHKAIIQHAVANGRKIFLGGRSMNDNVRIAHELGVIDIPRSAIRKLNGSVNDYRPEEVMILTTGSQGEPFAALSRISRDEHPHIILTEDDLIAFSSSPIPGNERGLYTVIDAIYRKGSSIVRNVDIDIHASGHGFRGDIKMMHSIVAPKYIAPIHGEYFMRIGHRQLAIDELGYEKENVIMLENGIPLEVLGGVVRKSTKKIPMELVFVDGKDHADMSESQLKERLAMSEGGLLTVLLEVDKSTKKLTGEPRTFAEGFLENKNVHGVILDRIKVVYAKLLQRKGELLKDKEIIEEVSKNLREELLMEVDREPVIQVLVTKA